MATPEAKELALVGKVEMRIALADTDPKLESILKTYLPPLLLKLASEHVDVRNKVISICQHVNTRIKPQAIQLPVAALLKQFKENPDSSLIRHFDLLYIQQGVSRLPVRERLELLPILVQGIADDTGKSVLHGSQLFNLILRLLAHFQLPPRGSKDDVELRDKLHVTKRDAEFLSFWFGKLILFNFVRSMNTANAPIIPNPGLSPEEYSFLTVQGKPDVWDPAADGGMNLAEAKVMASKFLASGMFLDEERFFPAVFASADTNSRIADIGDDMLKRTVPVTDLEDPAIVRRLYDVYFGSPNEGGQAPVRPALKTKILGYLAKSVVSTTFTNRVLRIVEEGLTSGTSDPTFGVIANSTSLRGREASKLRSAIFTFVNFMARHGDSADLHAVGPTLVNSLRLFIEDQGWPRPNPEEDLALRGYGYEVIGLLAKAAPEGVLLEPKLGLLRWLFRSLAEDTSGKDIGFSIDEALSSVLGVFAGSVSSEVRDSLRDLLLEQMTLDQHTGSEDASKSKPRRSTRYVAVRYANRCLPYDDIAARWIDILAVSGPTTESQEVREEGGRGLDPHWSRLLHSSHVGSSDELAETQFPDFTKLIAYVFSQPGDDLGITEYDWRPVERVQYFKLHQPRAFAATVKYCRQMLMTEALKSNNITIAIDVDWERKLDTAVSSDKDARSAIRSFFKKADVEQGPLLQAILTLIRAAFEGLLWNGGAGLSDCGEKFVELCSLSPDELMDMSRTPPAFRALEPVVFSNDVRTRTIGAHAYGLLATHSAVVPSDLEESLALLLGKSGTWKEAVGSQINEAAGALLAVGYYFSRLAARRRGASATEATLQKCLRIASDILEGVADKSLKEACYLGISQLCLFFVIKSDGVGDYIAYDKAVDKLMDSAKTGDEKAIIALGHFAMFPNETDGAANLQYAEDHIFSLHEIRQVEAQFAVGEAVTCLAAGWQSAALASEMDVAHPPPAGPSRTNTLPRVLDRVLKNCRNTKPALKKASVIWLLCLVQFCGHLEAVKQKLGECQAAFKYCLSDRDDVVQEAASRGLGLVYEKGDRSLKDDLVRDLVGSFSDNKPKLSGNVSEDTQLFEPGALPTGDGSVTTYKDILNLASEVGDSSLVYRFMSLASNNAIWSSRAAFGRFGLSSVFSDSSVDGYLAQNPKLYPKLYRYRFDPNPNVQRSMTDIWNALVRDSSSTIDKHFDGIMADLLQNILTKEWRVREACCGAIADLIQGRSIEKYEKYLGEVWTKCFKVLDDIKESVRVAAASLARVLTGILTRSLEAGDSSTRNADAMLKHVIPFIMSTSGLESGAAEVQLFALNTLLQIIKKGGPKPLQPFIPDLIECLIGLLSTFEDERINTLYLNASKYNIKEHAIDDARLANVRASPLMEAIERCLDLLDDESMKALVPRMENAMKTAVSLPSKVGASRILVSLSTRHNQLFRPYADHFLKLIHKHIHDRNETVSTAYAASAGYVARTASEAQILATVTFCKRLYFESEDDRSRTASGDIIFAISKHASDKFNALSSDILPFTFVAKHDSHAHVKELFEKTWNDNVGGSRAVQLYVKDIVELAQAHLDSPKWTLKHTVAKAIAGTADALASSLDDISLANAETLWPALDKALGGKSWEGKEVVLQAFARFVKKGGKLWRARPAVAEQIKKV
ncbi:ARM repeat-containing protein [Saccharata proteae CBS 121410]|uniref:ARM repeat-containing protein n=1 Tax=Saccharata proteae CBS 121410 TaxID=1314787 RepID=A0A9P4HM43_9PEZI|nr:ARM repeat-containing protein [Saccharata proteae CBS 121410]